MQSGAYVQSDGSCAHVGTAPTESAVNKRCSSCSQKVLFRLCTPLSQRLLRTERRPSHLSIPGYAERRACIHILNITMDAPNLLLLVFSIAVWPSVAFAQSPTPTSSSSATGVVTSFPTIMSGQDGVGIPDGSVGSQATGNEGNSGTSQGSFHLSTGAIIGISVAVGVTVIAIGELVVLWRMLCNMGLTHCLQSSSGCCGSSPNAATGISESRYGALPEDLRDVVIWVLRTGLLRRIEGEP
jgi:hypothetical protein